MKQYIVITFVLVIAYNTAKGQGTDISYAKSKFYIEGYISPMYSSIINNFEATNDFNAEALPGLNIGFNFGKNISNNMGLKVGLSYGLYNSNQKLNNFNKTFLNIDSENEAYEMIVSGNNITEKQSIATSGLRILYTSSVKITPSVNLHANAGFQLTYLIVQKYNIESVFSYEGYYSEYNVTFTNLPEYGFSNNYKLNSSDDLTLKSLNLALLAEFTIQFKLNQKQSILVGVNFDYGLSNLAKPHENYILSNYPGEYNSMSNGSSKVNTKAIGAVIAYQISL